MALVTTISEIKALLPRLVSNLSEESTLPNFDRAEEKYLVPLIGRAFYNDLKTKYAANSLDAAYLAVKPKVQLVVSAYGILMELPLMQAMITDQGVRQANTQTLPAAYKHQYNSMKNGVAEAALDGVEVLLQFLFDNKADYADWTASEEYKSFGALLIKTGVEFDQYVRLHNPMRTFWAMRNIMADAQENYVRNSIGPDLLEYLNGLASPSDGEKYVLKLLKKALANYTIKHALAQLSARIDHNGFTIVVGDGENGETAGRSTNTGLLDMQMREYETNAAAYLAKANYELSVLYAAASAGAFKTAYEAGPLQSYKQPSERDRKNSSRKGIFRA